MNSSKISFFWIRFYVCVVISLVYVLLSFLSISDCGEKRPSFELRTVRLSTIFKSGCALVLTTLSYPDPVCTSDFNVREPNAELVGLSLLGTRLPSTMKS